VTFAKYAENWWTADHPYVEGRIARGHKLTATYLVVMRGHLENHVKPYFEDKRLAQITSRQIEEWILAPRKKRLSPSTINHALRCLNVMLKEAARHGIIVRDPSAFITGLAERPLERGILTGAEIKALLDEKAIGKVRAGDRKHYTLNLLAASTGMRMGELQALPVSAVHENYVEVLQSWERRDGIKAGTKTGAGRLVPLPAYTARHLNELIASSPYQNPDDLVFYGQDRHIPITPRMILAGLYGALKRIKITPEEREERNITFHSWRHFLNTALRVAKVSDPLVQRVTGHKTQQMTDHYSTLRS
jgi:integrase